MHLGLPPSFGSNFPLPTTESVKENVHVQGLLELTRLFVTFDRCNDVNVSEEGLIETETMLQGLSMSAERTAVSRLADHCITREWMRTMIWQRALSLRLLSSQSKSSLMNFTFPMQVSRDLLGSLNRFSSHDLLPLGRDQVRYSEFPKMWNTTDYFSAVEVFRSSQHPGGYIALQFRFSQKINVLLRATRFSS